MLKLYIFWELIFINLPLNLQFSTKYPVNTRLDLKSNFKSIFGGIRSHRYPWKAALNHLGFSS